MVSGQLLKTILLLGSGAACLQAQTARPLADGVTQLEKQLGVPINYEDPRFACPDELRDVSAEVQNPAQKAAHPNARIMVPKGRAHSLDYRFSHLLPGDDPYPYVAALIAAHEADGFPGRFTIARVGTVVTGAPHSVKGSDCVWTPSRPPWKRKSALRRRRAMRVSWFPWCLKP